MTDPTPRENVANALQLLNGLLLFTVEHSTWRGMLNVQLDGQAIRVRLQAALAQLDGRTIL